MALLYHIAKIRLEPWHSIVVIAHATVPEQVEIYWESERQYTFVLSLQRNLI